MAEQARDPVCGMAIDKEKAAIKAEYQGQTYYFCARVCKDKFEKNPEKYAHAGSHEHRHGA